MLEICKKWKYAKKELKHVSNGIIEILVSRSCNTSRNFSGFFSKTKIWKQDLFAYGEKYGEKY